MNLYTGCRYKRIYYIMTKKLYTMKKSKKFYKLIFAIKLRVYSCFFRISSKTIKIPNRCKLKISKKLSKSVDHGN